MNILSIQSWVAYGHVGNASAAFPLQRLGAEVWAVNTVQFSNHPGYGGFTGDRYSGAQVAALIDGIEARAVLPRCDGVLSGYLGAQDVGEAVRNAVVRVKSANPAALYCCDPVIGDDGRVYVASGIAELFRDVLVPMADIATPNQFELSCLTGQGCATHEAAKAAMAALRATGPRVVLLTSLTAAETPDDAVDLMASEGDETYLVRTPRLPILVNGAGDLISALFLFHRLRTHSTPEALSRAASSVFGILRQTAEIGAKELLTVTAQDEFMQPTRVFTPIRC